MKSSGTAYILWFFLGCHYAYLGRWGTQILYWITLGGLGIWAFIDLFRIPSLISNHNYRISVQIDEIEKKEKQDNFSNNLAFVNASNQKNEVGNYQVSTKSEIGFPTTANNNFPVPSHQNQIDTLKQLKSLLDENIITSDEFQNQKNKILG